MMMMVIKTILDKSVLVKNAFDSDSCVIFLLMVILLTCGVCVDVPAVSTHHAYLPLLIVFAWTRLVAADALF